MDEDNRAVAGGEAAALARAILWGAAVAGLLDLAFAFTYWGARGVATARILRGIAAGLLGAEAFRGGIAPVVLGFGLVFVITAGAAAVYAMAYRELPLLGRRPLPCGLLYGAAVNLFVSEVVVPLSAARPAAGSPRERLIPLVACAVCVGLPIALAARRFLGAPSRCPEIARPLAGHHLRPA